MSKLSNLSFLALNLSGDNYLSWKLDAEVHLDVENLGETIKPDNKESTQAKAKALILLRHHLHESLKCEYLTMKDPLVLWNALKDRYDHQKTVMLPNARHKWLNLRYQDYKSVPEYNLALFHIKAELEACDVTLTDAELLEKTYSTFHVSHLILQQQYRQSNYKRYSELLAVLLAAEKNNEVLIKQHNARPTGAAPIPEANALAFHDKGRGRGRGRGRDKTRGFGRGRGRGRGNYSGSVNLGPRQDAKKHGTGGGGALTWTNPNFENDKKYKTTSESLCYRCGRPGHWEKTCRTAKHWVDLYQKSIKGKGKDKEINFIDHRAATSLDNGEDDNSDNNNVETTEDL